MPKREGLQPDFSLISDEFDTGAFHEFLPFSDLNGWVDKDSLINRASSAFRLWGRLGEIRALSFLSYVGPDPEQVYFIGYDHNRLDHSLVVAMTSGKIGRRNNLPIEQINALEIAGLLHDNGTPALGDAIKYIDPQNLGEEEFWDETLSSEGKKFIRGIGLSREVIDQIIRNQGILGQVLDIADRITYTMKDLYEVIGDVRSKINVHPYLIELRYPLSHHPDIGNIYKDVVIDRKREIVFFADSERLGVFLLLRALMHKHLYMEPISQGRDLFIANLIKPLYAVDGSRPFSPVRLRQMTDKEALDVLGNIYKFNRDDTSWIHRELTNWYPKHERCESREEAEQKAKDLGQKFLVIGIKECKGFDAGLSYLVVNEHQEIVPFEDADPGIADQIRRIEKDTRSVYVFYTDISEDTPINELLRRAYAIPPHSLAGIGEMG